jgi:hypothetical protein
MKTVDPPMMWLPPYGLLPTKYTERPLSELPPPRDFLPSADPDRQDLLTKKNAFVTAFADDIKEKYWPIWRGLDGAPDRSIRGWEGSAAMSMVDFTRQDLALLVQLRFKLRDYVTVDGRVVLRTHTECFETEDALDAKAPTTNFDEFRSYIPELPPALSAAFPALFRAALENKVGPLTMQWKTLFQRPRPYQAALLLGIGAVTHRIATTSLHPSLVAGHCMQGLFGGVGVHLLLRHEDYYSSKIQTALSQYATDFGDRRVLAGAHYPSDSLISWLACFKLLEYVVKPDDIKPARAFMKNSIAKSHVWNVVSDPTRTYSCRAYEALVNEVSQLVVS